MLFVKTSYFGKPYVLGQKIHINMGEVNSSKYGEDFFPYNLILKV